MPMATGMSSERDDPEQPGDVGDRAERRARDCRQDTDHRQGHRRGEPLELLALDRRPAPVAHDRGSDRQREYDDDAQDVDDVEDVAQALDGRDPERVRDRHGPVHAVEVGEKTGLECGGDGADDDGHEAEPGDPPPTWREQTTVGEEQRHEDDHRRECGNEPDRGQPRQRERPRQAAVEGGHAEGRVVLPGDHDRHHRGRQPQDPAHRVPRPAGHDQRPDEAERGDHQDADRHHEGPQAGLLGDEHQAEHHPRQVRHDHEPDASGAPATQPIRAGRARPTSHSIHRSRSRNHPPQDSLVDSHDRSSLHRRSALRPEGGRRQSRRAWDHRGHGERWPNRPRRPAGPGSGADR